MAEAARLEIGEGRADLGPRLDVRRAIDRARDVPHLLDQRHGVGIDRGEARGSGIGHGRDGVGERLDTRGPLGPMAADMRVDAKVVAAALDDQPVLGGGVGGEVVDRHHDRHADEPPGDAPAPRR